MVIIDPAFCGPSTSGNGGYTCGLMAEEFGSLAQVTLFKPPPLGRELHFERTNELTLFDEEHTVIAKATAGELAAATADFVDPERIRLAQSTFPGGDHPFPRCFTCGTARQSGDGLLIHSPYLGDGVAAGFWRAHEKFFTHSRIPTPIMWAAMDCPGYWAVGYQSQPAVLGRMTGEILGTVQPGNEYISVGQLKNKDGRKITSLTAIYDLDAQLIARSEQTWIEIDHQLFEKTV